MRVYFRRLQERLDRRRTMHLAFRWIDPTNIGDMVCSPVDYFPSLKKFRSMCIRDCDSTEMCRGKTVIIGGGGLLKNDWFEPSVKNVINARNVRAFWGTGVDRYSRHRAS